MQRDKNLGLNLVTVRLGRYTPAESVYWRLLQTRRQSDPELESVLTLAFFSVGFVSISFAFLIY